MKILLLDMDGVLLEPGAYHQALRETVALVGKALGYQEAALTQEDIEVFESVGVTSEWDSAAICSALLLRSVWRIFPEIRLPSAPPLPQLPAHDLPAPDFQAFFLSLGMTTAPESSSTLLAEHALLVEGQGYTPEQLVILRATLQRARLINGSLTHRLFQEMVLGSREFEQAYDMTAHLRYPGYLRTHDLPTLPVDARGRLLAWLERPEQAAAVFTNRPSRPPQGSAGAPEAELGLQAAGLEDLPLVGGGGLNWLAAQQSMPLDSFLKPSGVHALAALRLVIGDALEQALIAAAALALEQESDPSWAVLDGARIYVFEDAAKGLQSASAALQNLRGVGVRADVFLLGVTTSRSKQQALEAAGAQVFPNLVQALQHSGALASPGSHPHPARAY